MNFRVPGALCQELGHWSGDVLDGTTQKTVAPKPGAVGNYAPGVPSQHASSAASSHPSVSAPTHAPGLGDFLHSLYSTVCSPESVLGMGAGAVKEKADAAKKKAESTVPKIDAPAAAGVSHVLAAPETYIGNDSFTNDDGNHECVEFVRQAAGAPQTALWKQGAHVEPGSNIPKGTWVATFVSGKFYGHVGAFDQMDAKGNLTLFDQYNSKGQVGKTTYHVKPQPYTDKISNDPSKYYIVLW